MIKSENPDLLVNITKERERIDVNQYNAGWGYGWGYGWNPYLGGRTTFLATEGTLYIDLIDAKKKELVGKGKVLVTNENREKKKKLMSLSQNLAHSHQNLNNQTLFYINSLPLCRPFIPNYDNSNDITNLEDIKLLVDTFYSKVQKTTYRAYI
jgi:hypothetical protein